MKLQSLSAKDRSKRKRSETSDRSRGFCLSFCTGKEVDTRQQSERASAGRWLRREADPAMSMGDDDRPPAVCPIGLPDPPWTTKRSGRVTAARHRPAAALWRAAARGPAGARLPGP